jgi:hypothetical protein
MILKLQTPTIHPADKHRASNSEKRDRDLRVEAWNYSGTLELGRLGFSGRMAWKIHPNLVTETLLPV